MAGSRYDKVIEQVENYVAELNKLLSDTTDIGTEDEKSLIIKLLALSEFHQALKKNIDILLHLDTHSIFKQILEITCKDHPIGRSAKLESLSYAYDNDPKFKVLVKMAGDKCCELPQSIKTTPEFKQGSDEKSATKSVSKGSSALFSENRKTMGFEQDITVSWVRSHVGFSKF